MSHPRFLISVIAFISCSTVVFSICIGEIDISCLQLVQIVQGKSPLILQDVVLAIRIPRVLSAFVAGGLLALAGLLMQILLRNPLADPYVLGISGGAALTTLILILLGINGIFLTAGTWIGSLIAVFLIFALAKPNKIWNTQRVLLTGVALATGFGALISFILFISPEHELRGMFFWLIGDLNAAHLPILEATILILGLVLSFSMTRSLTVLLRGEQEAEALGINTKRLMLLLYLVSSALTAASVSLGGCIGFVGLIVPHSLRLLGLQEQRYLVPASVLLGGTLVTFADLLSKIIIKPAELPIGIVMALIGIPIFLFLLQRN